MSFKTHLKNELSYQKKTLKELAYETKISVRTLESYIYNREQMPKADIAVKIAKALNVTVEYLVSEDDKEPKRPLAYFVNEGTLQGDKKKNELISLLRQRSRELGTVTKQLRSVNFEDTYLEYYSYDDLKEILKIRNDALRNLQNEYRCLIKEKTVSPQNELSNDKVEEAAEKYYKDGNLPISDKDKYLQLSALPESDIKKLYSLSIEQIEAIIAMIGTFTKAEEVE